MNQNAKIAAQTAAVMAKTRPIAPWRWSTPGGAAHEDPRAVDALEHHQAADEHGEQREESHEDREADVAAPVLDARGEPQRAGGDRAPEQQADHAPRAASRPCAMNRSVVRRVDDPRSGSARYFVGAVPGRRPTNRPPLSVGSVLTPGRVRRLRLGSADVPPRAALLRGRRRAGPRLGAGHPGLRPPSAEPVDLGRRRRRIGRAAPGGRVAAADLARRRDRRLHGDGRPQDLPARPDGRPCRRQRRAAAAGQGLARELHVRLVAGLPDDRGARRPGAGPPPAGAHRRRHGRAARRGRRVLLGRQLLAGRRRAALRPRDERALPGAQRHLARPGRRGRERWSR